MPVPSDRGNGAGFSAQGSWEPRTTNRRISSTEEGHLLALYGAFCLFLSTIEFLIPKPLPFLRLGLANLPILLALRRESPQFILYLVGLKVFGQALVNGTLFSFIFVFSTLGSLSSGITMTILSFLPTSYLSLIGISVMGALSSNLVQVLLARYFLLGEGAWLIAPPFLALGTVTGILLGGLALSLSGFLSPVLRSPFSHSSFLTSTNSDPTSPGLPSDSVTNIGSPQATHLPQEPHLTHASHPINPPDPLHPSRFSNPPEIPPFDPPGIKNFFTCNSFHQDIIASMGTVKIRIQKFLTSSLSPGVLFLTGVASLLPFLFTESLVSKAILTGFYFLCAGLSGKRIKLIPNLGAFLGITAANLVTPLGQVIFYVGTFPVTQGALRLGALKALSLLGMIALSRFTLRTYVPFPGRLGAVISRMFFYFEHITEQKIRLRRTHFWEDIRALIEEIWKEGVSPHAQADYPRAGQSQVNCMEPGRPQAAGPHPTTLKGYTFLILFLSVSWAALLF